MFISYSLGIELLSGQRVVRDNLRSLVVFLPNHGRRFRRRMVRLIRVIQLVGPVIIIVGWAGFFIVLVEFSVGSTDYLGEGGQLVGVSGVFMVLY